MKYLPRLVCAIGLALFVPAALAAPPQTINYQGTLTNPGGAPVNGAVVMTFRLYNAASGGTLLYTEAQPSVAVSNGAFNAVIGSVTPIALPFDVPYWLAVTINADGEMSPRQPLASSPYAFRAASLDSAATLAGSQVSGTISLATLPSSNLSGTIASAQLADNSVTQAKLSPVSGAAFGKVLGTDGISLQWQTVGAGSVTSVTAGAGLTGGTITGSGTIAVDPNSAALAGNFFKRSGNAFGGTAVLGTTDNQALELHVNGERTMRFEPNPTGPGSPNVIGGDTLNRVTAVVFGATIAGGGGATGLASPNRVTDLYGTVGGGYGNRAGNDSGSVVDAQVATVAGGKTMWRAVHVRRSEEVLLASRPA